MSQSPTIPSQIHQIQEEIPNTVRLIAVTKYVTTTEIKTAYASGLREFGESKIQDAQNKIQELNDLPGIQWHFIGHLQSNKAKLAVKLFDWIHSVDSLKLAKRLDRLAGEAKRHPSVCLQVKIRPDPAKHGWLPNDLVTDLAELQTLSHINVAGLMVILPKGLAPFEIAQSFQDTAQLAQSICKHPQHPLPLKELSMGMSNDYQLAISAGATMIRLGRILFPSNS